MVHIFHKMNLTDYKSGERFRSINYCCMKQLDSIHEQFRILAFEESPSVVQSTYSRPVVGTVSALVVGIPFGFAALTVGSIMSRNRIIHVIANQHNSNTLNGKYSISRMIVLVFGLISQFLLERQCPSVFG